jgi:hypothetical protein
MGRAGKITEALRELCPNHPHIVQHRRQSAAAHRWSPARSLNYLDPELSYFPALAIERVGGDINPQSAFRVRVGAPEFSNFGDHFGEISTSPLGLYPFAGAIRLNSPMQSHGIPRCRRIRFELRIRRAIYLCRRRMALMRAVCFARRVLMRLPESYRGGYISRMLEQSLPPEERAAVVKLLRDTIAADPYPLSPRIRTLKSALARLDPPATPAPEPIAAPKAWANSSIGMRKRRR